MPETKVPQYSVKHIDGVMHLTVQTESEKPRVAEKLRFQPPSIEAVDN